MCTHSCLHYLLLTGGNELEVVLTRYFLSLESREEGTPPMQTPLSVCLASQGVATAGARSSLAGERLVLGSGLEFYSVSQALALGGSIRIFQATTASPAEHCTFLGYSTFISPEACDPLTFLDPSPAQPTLTQPCPAPAQSIGIWRPYMPDMPGASPWCPDTFPILCISTECNTKNAERTLLTLHPCGSRDSWETEGETEIIRSSQNCLLLVPSFTHTLCFVHGSLARQWQPNSS